MVDGFSGEEEARSRRNGRERPPARSDLNFSVTRFPYLLAVSRVPGSARGYRLRVAGDL
jgi:hypothetical protein